MTTKFVQRSALALTLVAAASVSFAQSPRWTEDGTSSSFSLTNWTVDRLAPGVWAPGTTDPLGGLALQLGIRNADRGDLNGRDVFWNTQGRTRQTIKSSEVGGQIFIPADWSVAGNLRRTDLWAEHLDNETFPIIGFINNDPNDPFNPQATNFVPRIRVWDSATGVWDDLNLTIHYGAYNSVKIVDTGHSDQFFFNGAMVFELSGDSYTQDIGSGIQPGYQEVLVEGYNFGEADNETTLPDSGYDIFWKNVYSKDSPQAHADAYTVDSGATKPTVLNLFANDVDVAGNPFSLYGFTDPAHGQVNLNRGQVEYLPTGTYAGPDSFTYYIVDAFGQVSSALVSITDQYPIFSSMSFNPTNTLGGTTATGTITLTAAPATTTYTIALSSSDPSVTLPPTITVTSGTTVTFPITTHQVAADTTVNITATFHGKVLTKPFVVKADHVASISINQTSVLGGVTDASATITLQNAPTTFPVTVNLLSNSTGIAVQSSVVVPVGATSVTVPLVSSPVVAGATVIITANANGTPVTAHLSINAVRISAFSIANRILHSGVSTSSTVTLNGTLKPGFSVNVALANPTGLLGMPSILTITGTNFGTFTISNANTTNLTVIAPISVSLAGASSSSTVNVFPN